MLTLFTAEKDKQSILAKTFLDKAGVSYIERDIIQEHPNIDELQHYIDISGHSFFSFLRTKGFFGAFAIGERLGMMRDDLRVAFIAASGKMVRRPLLVGDTFVLFGFLENDWLQNLKLIRQEQGIHPRSISENSND